MMYREYCFPKMFQSHYRNSHYNKITTNKVKIDKEKLILETTIDEKSSVTFCGNNNSNKNSTSAEKEFSLNEILYVKEKSAWFQVVICLIFVILFMQVYNMVDIHNNSNILNIENLPIHIKNYGILFIITIGITYIISFFIGVPLKQIEIKFKNKERFVFFYYNWNKLEAKSFLEDLRYFNSNIKIKDISKRNSILIIAFIILNIFNISNKYIEISKENQLINSLAKGTCYTDISVLEGSLIKCRQALSKNDGYNNTYQLKDMGKNIKIKENVKRNINDIYYIIILKYYSEDNGELITTKYKALNASNEVTRFEYYNRDYYYEKNSNKIYEFNDPEFDLSKKNHYRKYTVEFYNGINKYENVYNFVISNSDEQEFENYEYKKISKIGKFESKYGTCNILKASYMDHSGASVIPRYEYICFIENNEGNHRGIVLTSKYGKDDYVSYFKSIIK